MTGTTLYFHVANSSVSGTLPATSQSSLTSFDNIDPLTTNRYMNTTIGTTQTSLAKALAFSTSPRNFYVSRWVSDTFSSNTSITSNTWTVLVAVMESNTAGHWPTQASSGKTQCCLYIWRPSTGAKIATVFDSLSATLTSNPGYNTEATVVQTFAGSAQSALAGDVLIFEFWAVTYASSAQTITGTFYYDGNSTAGDWTSISSVASNISTPQVLTFGTPLSPTACTVTGKSVTNKIINKH